MVAIREKSSGDGPDADPWDDYLQKYDTGRLAAILGNTQRQTATASSTPAAGQCRSPGCATISSPRPGCANS